MTTESKRVRVSRKRGEVPAGRTEKTLAWRRSKLQEGHKRQETFFEVDTLERLKKIAKDKETTVAGLIRKIVEDWLKARK